MQPEMKLRERATTSTNGAEAGPLDCRR